MNIELRPLLKSDNEQTALLLNNKKIWDNLKDYIPHPYNVTDADWFINFSNQDDTSNSFAIQYGDDLSGIITLQQQTDIYRLSAELGYWVGEEYWGKGIATKVIGLMVEYGFFENGFE